MLIVYSGVRRVGAWLRAGVFFWMQTTAFSPIVVGMLMFLFDFFEDQALAFMVFSVVWMTEIFQMMWVRGDERMRLFPSFSMGLLMSVFLYLYSFPLGFAYVAFLAWLLSVMSAGFLFLHHVALSPELRPPAGGDTLVPL